MSVNEASPMVVMGKVVAAQGIQGWVKVQTFTEYLDSLLDYDTWYMGNEQAWRPLEVLDASVHGGKVVIARLQGIADRTAAEKCKGMLIAIPRSELPEQEEGEYYWSDLIGLTVVNQAGEVFGTVDTLLETGANDVLVIKGDIGETLIPFIASVIQQVDLKGKTIRVDWQADYLK
ncbi:ribosome maturation factor RimM [Sideroxyarcus emersonii]|uniref:Ribosome maturation factor RimM n=1 Tax=Sideroxyarcus emersonii TaxID=2764705 RepID=A0AAN2C026_9PROT|nr:ribosome maturation factor RimM [Sideroxyarcus emersonii]BCK88703.1 ribosome maturation factor RimM [Sideroxyarcus emersonii]